MTARQLLTSAEFAKARGWSRSVVTRLKQAGRLVMVDGLIDAAASLSRILQTGGTRPDVAARHAADRTRRELGDMDLSGHDAGAGSAYQTARAVREKYAALSAKLEYDRALGKLVPVEDVELALRTFATGMRALLDNTPDRLAPLVAPITDVDDVHALLAEHCRGILAEMAADMERAATAAAQEAAQSKPNPTLKENAS